MILSCGTRRVGEAWVLDLSGKITLGEGAALLRRCVEQAVEEGGRHVVLNLVDVAYVDSAGLGAIVGSYTKLKGQGGVMRLLNPQARVTELLKITELDRIMPPFSREDEAVASGTAA